MKRTIIIVSLLYCFSAIGAQEVNGSLASSASYTQLGDVSALGSQSASVFFTTPLGADWNFQSGLTLTASATYYGATGTVTPVLPWTLAGIDFPVFNLAYGATQKDEGIDHLSFTVGRFPYVDPSGNLFAYRLDGMNLQASYALMSLRFVFGYTGLLPSVAPFISTAADLTYGNPDFAPPRAVAVFSLRSVSIYGHDAFLAFTVHEDLRAQSQLIPEYETVQNTQSSGPASSAYLTAGFNGSPTAALSYSGYGIFEFGRSLSYIADPTSTSTGYRYIYENIRAWAFGGQAQYAIGPALSANLRLLYGSGDPDATSAGNGGGNSTQFVPITIATGLVVSPDPANITEIDAGFSYKPFITERFGWMAVQATSKTIVLVKNGAGPVSLTGTKPDSGMGLLGIEEDLGASLPLVSDVTLGGTLGLYLPMAASYDPSYIQKSPLEYSISASLSIAL